MGGTQHSEWSINAKISNLDPIKHLCLDTVYMKQGSEESFKQYHGGAFSEIQNVGNTTGK